MEAEHNVHGIEDMIHAKKQQKEIWMLPFTALLFYLINPPEYQGKSSGYDDSPFQG